MNLSSEPETIFDPSGEKSRQYTVLLWAFCFSSTGASVAGTQQARVSVQNGAREDGTNGAPASHALIDPSLEPEMICLPSGEKSTVQVS